MLEGYPRSVPSCHFTMPMQLPDDGDPLAPHAMSASELKTLLATERTGQAFLAVRDQTGRLRLFEPPSVEETRTVGRRAETDISIPWDGLVSGVHAVLEHVGGELAIVDDGLSRNGTFVNGQRISGRQRLRDGDRVRVGRTVLVYRAPSARVAEATVTAVRRSDVLKLSDTQRSVLIALCRPFRDGAAFATPATNQEIASEVFLSVDGVKMHLRSLFAKFELGDLPQNQKRISLAERALQLGVVTTRDLDRSDS
jgi:pSer/pThr/pTyr-binding forkhead associated (FHA) protein